MTLMDKPETLFPHTQGKTIIEDVYAELRRGILNGSLEPGSRLRVAELRNRFGVGSSTVREALSRLLVENLVTTEGQRGFHVTPVSLDDFQQIASMRKLLEAEAVRQSVARGDDDWESKLVAAAHRLAKLETSMKGQEESSIIEWEVRNRDFHDALIGACRNSWLLNFRSMLYRHSVRYLRIAMVGRTTDRDFRGEHQAIFEAAVARDAELTVRLIESHIDRSVDDWRSRVADVLA